MPSSSLLKHRFLACSCLATHVPLILLLIIVPHDGQQTVSHLHMAIAAAIVLLECISRLRLSRRSASIISFKDSVIQLLDAFPCAGLS